MSMLSPLPIPERDAWSAQLRALAAQPLEYCPDFPIIAKRFEAWWAHDCLDRPVFVASADTNPQRQILRRLELLDQPDAWFDAKMQDMLQLHRVGDKLPTFRVDFGPVMLGGLFGGAVEFVSDTTWQHAFINDDWSNAPDWRVDASAWWELMRARLTQAADASIGKFVVHQPALGGAGDVLLNFRGSSALCLDVIDQPERITDALEKIYDGWREAFRAQYACTVGRGAAAMRWAGLWSNEPYFVAECDFNAMISPRQFERLFVPDLVCVAKTAGRTMFHLDGPDAARQIDVLLHIPELQAIQYVPGAGTPSALQKVALLRKIQDAGKSVQVLCPPDEVLTLCDELKPEGLAFWLETPLPPRELDALFEQFCKRYA